MALRPGGACTEGPAELDYRGPESFKRSGEAARRRDERRADARARGAAAPPLSPSDRRGRSGPAAGGGPDRVGGRPRGTAGASCRPAVGGPPVQPVLRADHADTPLLRVGDAP